MVPRIITHSLTINKGKASYTQLTISDFNSTTAILKGTQKKLVCFLRQFNLKHLQIIFRIFKFTIVNGYQHHSHKSELNSYTTIQTHKRESIILQVST